MLAIVVSGGAVLVSTAPAEAVGSPIRFATYNISHGDGGIGYKAWAVRRNPTTQLLNAMNADVIAIQEARVALSDGTPQMNQLVADMSPTRALVVPPAYKNYGVNNGVSPWAPKFFLYNPARLQPSGSGWRLLPMGTCTMPQASMQWTRFLDLSTNRYVLVVNAHIAVCSSAIRLNQAQTIKNEITQTLRDNNWNIPVVALGDYNTEPGNDPFDQMTATRTYNLPSGAARSYTLAASNTSYTTVNTGWNDGNPGAADGEPPRDFVFYEPARMTAGTLGITGDPAWYFNLAGTVTSPSDHYLLFSDLTFN